MFGLAVSADFEIAGLPQGEPDAGHPRPARLRLAPRSAVLAARPAHGGTRLSDRRDPEGRSVVRIDSHPGAGTFIVMRGEGAFAISADNTGADLAPTRRAAWRWQRVLIGQVLPLMAALNGLEVLHACAVEVDGRAIAVVGGSHSGKSTLAGTWIGRGATFMADDVVAVQGDGSGPPLVHPGPPLISVRAGAQSLLGDDALAAIGPRVGADHNGARIAVARRHEGPLPLGALVVLRRDERHERLEVRVEDPPDPRLILGSTFNFVVRTPQRLTAHLDLAAHIAATVPVIVADVGSGHRPAAVADAVQRALEAGA